MKNILYDKKSKARVFGTLIITAIVVSASFAVLFLIPQSPFVETGSAATTDYLYSRSITIDHTKINQSLSYFVAWIYKSSDNDFKDHILAGGEDIAFYDSSNSTQLNHEIEIWEKSTGELGVWVNITQISMSVDTTIWIYYGDSDTAETKNHNPESVWHTQYDMVQHMVGAAYTDIDDSTSNNNDCGGERDSPTYNATGKLGKCVEYDGSDDGNGFGDFDSNYITVSGWIYADSTGDYPMSKHDGSATNKIQWVLHQDSTDGGLARFRIWPSGGGDWYDSDDLFSTTGSWVHLTGTYDGTYTKLYINGELEGSDSHSAGTIQDTVTEVASGCRYTPNNGFYNGRVDEYTIQNQAKNSSWVNATFLNQNSPSTFLTFGDEISDESSFTLYGLVNNRITFSGTANTQVWCNSSGDYNEHLRENVTANATTNVTVFLVHIGDLNDTDAWINASNIALFVSSDNVSYASMGSFTDGGSNKSVNKSTWPGGAGDNPFDGAGITDKSVDIYFLFKLSIPSDAPTDEFYSAAIDSCWIKPGHYV